MPAPEPSPISSLWSIGLLDFWIDRLAARAMDFDGPFDRFGDQVIAFEDPDGMVVGEIQGELDIPNSTLSHHLEKLKNEDLVGVRRDGTYLWYTANTATLQELLGFLYAECCTRNKAIKPEAVVRISGKGEINGH